MQCRDIEQGSEQWLAHKAGKWSASRAKDLMAKGQGKTRANLIADVVAERMTGRYTEGFENANMRRGKELEQEAREAYEFEVGASVEQVGFIDHPTIPNCGASPDSLVGDDGLLEIKCQNNARHIEAKMNGAHAKEYYKQAQWQMMVTGRAWCDVISYNPAFPPELQLAITRLERDDELIIQFVGEIAKAEAEVQSIIKELKAIQERSAA
jgi:putative phage-type endonuclease